MVRMFPVKALGAMLTAVGSTLFIVAVPALGGPEVAAPVQADQAEAGFILVDGQNLDDIPKDSLHVGCTFQIDFYNFAEGVGEATVRFVMLPPTEDVGLTVSGDTSPDIGEDPAGGDTDLDASVTYTLVFDGEPDPVEGAYHVRLFINAPGATGSDGEYRPFWVMCGDETTTTTTTVPTTSTTSTTTVPTTTTTTSTTTVPTTTVPSSTSPVTSTVPTTSVPSSTLPSTSETSTPPGNTTVPPTDFDSGLGGSTASPGDAGVAQHSPWALAAVVGGLALAAGGLTVLIRRPDSDAS